MLCSVDPSLLPARVNRVYDGMGGEKASGVLLHAKFPGQTFGARPQKSLSAGQDIMPIRLDIRGPYAQ